VDVIIVIIIFLIIIFLNFSFIYFLFIQFFIMIKHRDYRGVKRKRFKDTVHD